MGHIKKFDEFIRESTSIASSPTPTKSPTTKPGTPGVAPGKKPSRPTPIRRDKPSVEPDPKAKLKLKKATMDDVLERYDSIISKNKD